MGVQRRSQTRHFVRYVCRHTPGFLRNLAARIDLQHYKSFAVTVASHAWSDLAPIPEDNFALASASPVNLRGRRPSPLHWER